MPRKWWRSWRWSWRWWKQRWTMTSSWGKAWTWRRRFSQTVDSRGLAFRQNRRGWSRLLLDEELSWAMLQTAGCKRLNIYKPRHLLYSSVSINKRVKSENWFRQLCLSVLHNISNSQFLKYKQGCLGTWMHAPTSCISCVSWVWVHWVACVTYFRCVSCF